MPKQDPKTIININDDPGLSRTTTTKKIVKKEPDISIPKFHWTKDKIDNRDYIYKSTVVKTSSLVDLRPFCSPIEDQGNLGSCTGQSVAGAIELLNKRSGKQTDVSRLFIYYYERLLEGTVNYDNGAYIRDGIKATNKYGAPLEKYWPYYINQFRTQPSQPAIIDGAKRKVTLYERAADFNACKNALANGYPVIVGFLVYSSFVGRNVTKTGIMPYPNVARETLLGGHAVLLVGYNDAKNHFIVRNSWGVNWGDRGYFYMPYRVIQNTQMSDDFWVIKSVNNP